MGSLRGRGARGAGPKLNQGSSMRFARSSMYSSWRTFQMSGLRRLSSSPQLGILGWPPRAEHLWLRSEVQWERRPPADARQVDPPLLRGLRQPRTGGPLRILVREEGPRRDVPHWPKRVVQQHFPWWVLRRHLRGILPTLEEMNGGPHVDVKRFHDTVD